jgi:hypothetical protein
MIWRREKKRRETMYIVLLLTWSFAVVVYGRCSRITLTENQQVQFDSSVPALSCLSSSSRATIEQLAVCSDLTFDSDAGSLSLTSTTTDDNNNWCAYNVTISRLGGIFATLINDRWTWHATECSKNHSVPVLIVSDNNNIRHEWTSFDRVTKYSIGVSSERWSFTGVNPCSLSVGEAIPSCRDGSIFLIGIDTNAAVLTAITPLPSSFVGLQVQNARLVAADEQHAWSCRRQINDNKNGQKIETVSVDDRTTLLRWNPETLDDDSDDNVAGCTYTLHVDWSLVSSSTEKETPAPRICQLSSAARYAPYLRAYASLLDAFSDSSQLNTVETSKKKKKRSVESQHKHKKWASGTSKLHVHTPCPSEYRYVRSLGHCVRSFEQQAYSNVGVWILLCVVVCSLVSCLLVLAYHQCCAWLRPSSKIRRRTRSNQ